MIVLDTTVLIYAKGAEHPLREPCRRLMASIAAAAIDATTTVEVIQEFVHVRARRRGRADAAAMGRAYAELLEPLLSVTRRDLDRGLELFESVEEIGAFDTVLAAAALHAKADALVSADSAFVRLPGLTHIFPDAEGVERLLR